MKSTSPGLTLLAIAILLTGYRMWVIRHLGIDLYVDEAYYWGWSKALDWGYFSKPPVVAALIAASTAWLGDGLLAIKLPSLVLYPVTSLVICRLATALFDERVGLWSGLAFLTMPLVGALGLFVSTDAPLMLFWSLGMLALWRGMRSDGHWGPWIALGLTVGAGLLTKYTMAAFLPSALLVMLAGQDGRRALATAPPWIALLLALAIFAPNLWWNWTHDFPTFRHTADITQLDDGGEHTGNLGEFVLAQWISVGPLLFLAMLWGMLRGLARVRAPEWRLLLGMSVPLLGLVAVQAIRGGANGNWAAPAFAAGVVAAVAWLAETRRWKTLGISICANLILVSGVYHWPAIAEATGVQMKRALDPYKRARGWQQLAREIAPVQRQHQDAILVAPDRELLAHLIYFLRPAAYASWNPAGRVTDHYQLTTSLARATGRDVLFVTRKPLPPEIAARFDSAEDLGTKVVPIHPDFERRVHLFLLKGFRGYPSK